MPLPRFYMFERIDDHVCQSVLFPFLDADWPVRPAFCTLIGYVEDVPWKHADFM